MYMGQAVPSDFNGYTKPPSTPRSARSSMETKSTVFFSENEDYISFRMRSHPVKKESELAMQTPTRRKREHILAPTVSGEEQGAAAKKSPKRKPL